MIKLLKTQKRIIITKVRIVVTSGREKQEEVIREEQMGRYIIANVLFLKMGDEFTSVLTASSFITIKLYFVKMNIT